MQSELHVFNSNGRHSLFSLKKGGVSFMYIKAKIVIKINKIITTIIILEAAVSNGFVKEYPKAIISIANAIIKPVRPSTVAVAFWSAFCEILFDIWATWLLSSV